MDDIVIGLSKYHNWLTSYCQFIIFEYERFIYLEFKFKNLIAPEIIEQCWQYHVLNMEHYYRYCHAKYKKVIPYKPSYFENENEKKVKINKTMELYNSEYGNIKYVCIWSNNSCFDRTLNHTNINKLILFVHNKSFNYFPILQDNISTLRELTSSKYNINVDKVFIFINKRDEKYNYNLERLYKFYKYKYNKGNGFYDNKSKNNIALPNNISLMDLCSIDMKKLYIVFT